MTAGVSHTQTPRWGREVRREEERGGEGSRRSERHRTEKKQKNKRGASLLKCGKTGELIENDKVRDNKQKDLSSG